MIRAATVVDIAGLGAVKLEYILVGLVVATAIFALTIWRPAAGCALLVVAVPLTTGLGRGTVVPLLRPNEALAVVVLAGLLVTYIPSRRQRVFNGLDLAVISFAVLSIMIAGLVLFVWHPSALHSPTTVRNAFGPIQFLAFYALFSRIPLPGRDLRRVLNLALLASLLVGGVAIAEQLNVPGVRDFIATNFASPDLRIPGDTAFRPTSTLGHFSAVGAFAAINYILALALLAVRHPDFSGKWLGMVAAVNLMAMLASNTWAPVVGVPFATIAILWYARRLPRALIPAVAALGLAVILFWPALSARATQQEVPVGTTFGSLIPQTLQTRINWWEEFFIPGLLPEVWLGTGTLVPAIVPPPLGAAVDNEYLGAAFRAGIVGLVLLCIMLITIAGAGWQSRASPDPYRRALGAACLAAVISVALIGLTAEYLTYGGVSQEFAMLTGLLSGLIAAPALVSGLIIVRLPAAPRWGRWLPDDLLRPATLRRLIPEGRLVRSAAVLFAGNSAARLLGFLFAVGAARLLRPADFGLLAFGLAIALIAATLLTVAPKGMARFLARHQDDRGQQELYVSNWLVVVGVTLAVSLVLLLPIGFATRLSPGMLVGAAANLLGVAFFETYREAQRGLDRYRGMTVYYILANLLQLVGIVVLAAVGVRRPAAFLTVYGLSSVAALLIMELVSPIPLRLARRTITWQRVSAIGRFARPLLFQTVFYAIWFGADVLLVQRFLGPVLTGNYAAAKTLINLLMLAPAAIGIVIGPQVARLSEGVLRPFVLGALALTAAVTLPLAGLMVVLRHPLIALIFGHKYPLAARPLAVLVVGTAIYAFYRVLENVWIGLGHPKIDAVASAVGMIVTVGAAFILIHHFQLLGAAAAYSLGSLAQLIVMGGYTAWALFTGETSRVGHFVDQTIAEPLDVASA